MRGLDPHLYQRQIHLSKDAKSVAQRRYRMNLNYVIKVKGGDRQIVKSMIYLAVKQFDRSSAQKERKNMGVCGLSEVERRHRHRCIPTPFYGWSTGRGSGYLWRIHFGLHAGIPGQFYLIQSE